MIDKTCERCSKAFRTYREQARFCSKTCSRRSRCVSLDERFWAKVDRRGPDECWEWQARRNMHGYGTFQLQAKQSKLAHRVCWQITNGEIPDGISVCHRCDNPACVNPAHLFLGTHLDNMRDMFAKGRRTAAHGNRHHWSKLCSCAVMAIRALASEGVSQRDLARRFGVSRNCARSIIHGETWKEVA